jgi:ParB family transcriptional regulator, chromosome partitioning protein
VTSRPNSPRLGRGLAALLGDIAVQPAGPPSAELRQVALDLLEPNPYQPRSNIEPEALEDLASSIRAQGILQPIVIRPHPSDPDRFQIIAGERRWRAAALAGLHEVPAVHREMTDADVAVTALVENLQRADLNPMDEAEGLNRLVQEFGMTHEALGYAVSKSRAHIGNMIRLLRLPPRAQEEVRRGNLSFGHARALLGHSDPESLLNKVILDELSVRETEALVAQQPKKPPRTGISPRQIDAEEWENDLSQRIGYRVTITSNKSGAGQLAIRFASMEQLEEIVGRLGQTPAFDHD